MAAATARETSDACIPLHRALSHLRAVQPWHHRVQAAIRQRLAGAPGGGESSPAVQPVRSLACILTGVSNRGSRRRFVPSAVRPPPAPRRKVLVQTLLAYAWERDAPAERIQAGLSRIEQWYGRLWDGVSAAATATDRLGLQLWHRSDEACRWPAWATGGGGAVATLHVPLGYHRLVDPATLEDAPVALARRLHVR